MDVNEMGNKIKKQRVALNMTQKDLAKEMNVSNQLISKWETGESVPSLEYLDALCKALQVEYSYFISDSESKQPETDKIAEPTKRVKFKFNKKLFIIIVSAFFAAALIAALTVLTVYVFIPSARRTKYLDEIEKAFDDYFSLGYYSINAKSELDGDILNDCRLDGYFDEDGNPVFKDTKIVKDDILTFTYEHTTKYHYIADKTYNTLDELATDRLAAIQNSDNLNDEDGLDEIKYIRKVKGGYYLEMSDDFFFDDLSGTQKKNFKLTDKIKGKIEIKDGLFNFMEITVKYYNKPDNEHFTIKISLEFIAEKPVIEHDNLENRLWGGTYIGNEYYLILPSSDTTPVCEELLSKEEFVSRLSGGKATKLDLDYDFNSIVIEDRIKDGGDCYYYLDGRTVKILNKTDLSLKTTVELVDSYPTYTHVYNGNIYWKNSGDYFYVKNINSGKTELLFKIYYYSSYKLEYNGGYAICYGDRDKTYNVIDLTQKRVISSYTSISYAFLDSAGYFYGKQTIDGAYVPVVYKDGIRTVLNGKDFYIENRVLGDIYTEGDSIFTQENDTIYRYENGELKEQLTTSDPRFEDNYHKLTNGYCFTNTTSRYNEIIFDENGKALEFEKFKLKEEDGSQEIIDKYSSNEIIAVLGDKLIVSLKLGNYMAVYDENDLTKPLYYMKSPERYGYSTYFIEVRNVGENTIIGVRINSVDYYGYELYYF